MAAATDAFCRRRCASDCAFFSALAKAAAAGERSQQQTCWKASARTASFRSGRVLGLLLGNLQTRLLGRLAGCVRLVGGGCCSTMRLERGVHGRGNVQGSSGRLRPADMTSCSPASSCFPTTSSTSSPRSHALSGAKNRAVNQVLKSLATPSAWPTWRAIPTNIRRWCAWVAAVASVMVEDSSIRWEMVWKNWSEVSTLNVVWSGQSRARWGSEVHTMNQRREAGLLPPATASRASMTCIS